MSDCVNFKIGNYVVYPSHGVGKIVSLEQFEVDGMSVDLYVIDFERDHMMLRLPIKKAVSVGLRDLVEKEEAEKALDVLAIKQKKKKIMWSRRAQEYEQKINSGKLELIAEVIKELYRGPSSTEQSYSERQIFQTAFDRFIKEISIVNKVAEEEIALDVENRLRDDVA